MESRVKRWGDEIYFGVKEVSGLTEQLTREVSIGDIGFCPAGNLLCVFFGPTPASVLERPVAENPVVVVGRTLASPDELRGVPEGAAISVIAHDTPAFVPPAKAAPTTPASAVARDGFGERKLSQSEIDALVQQLLAEKKRSQQ